VLVWDEDVMKASAGRLQRPGVTVGPIRDTATDVRLVHGLPVQEQNAARDSDPISADGDDPLHDELFCPGRSVGIEGMGHDNRTTRDPSAVRGGQPRKRAKDTDARGEHVVARAQRLGHGP
jgi:hypothetical protein